MTDYNPVQIEAAIRDCVNQIAEGVKICGERYSAWRTAERLYDVAYAYAYIHANGPAHEKKYHAELGTQDEREARDVADAAYRYADRRARALEADLRGWQSTGASVRQMYGAAGRGEGA